MYELLIRRRRADYAFLRVIALSTPTLWKPAARNSEVSNVRQGRFLFLSERVTVQARTRGTSLPHTPAPSARLASFILSGNHNICITTLIPRLDLLADL